MKLGRKSLGGAFLALAALSLASCGEAKESKSSTKTKTATITTTDIASPVEKYTVSFDTQGGSIIYSQEVEKGSFATKPEDPTKENYNFTGWYKEASCENDFDFEAEAITADTKVYAGWFEANASDASKATFLWNYEDATTEVYKEVVFKNGGRITKPEDPTRAGYEFSGWYTSTTYETAYSKATKYDGDQTFYAKWLKVFTMEAEDTQLTNISWSIELDGVVTQGGDKKGSNFSGNVNGKNLIRTDVNASNGKFVWGCMNLEEGYIDFEFVADKADDNAQLNIVLSAEFWGFTLTPSTFKVLVNPKSNASQSVKYADIDLTFVETSTSSTTNPKWVDAYINTIKIQEGKNLIRLLVNNDIANSVGTIKAQGPIVDCIKVKSTSELVMTKYDND